MAYNSSETTQCGVSDATLRNWEELQTELDERLTTRANKIKSKKTHFPFRVYQ